MTTSLRPELETLPQRLKTLPVDERGYVVPWFVAWMDGKPEFRAMDRAKFTRAVREKRCWVCGGTLGVHLAFVAGPMCGINRNVAEPPSHLECAEWSARNCPFLTRPKMVRRQDDEMNVEKLAEQTAGHAIPRNPGVALVWITKSYRLYNAGEQLPNIEIGPPDRVIFYACGRLATRAEVAESVESGLPILMELAERQDRDEPHVKAVAHLMKMKADFERWYPNA